MHLRRLDKEVANELASLKIQYPITKKISDYENPIEREYLLSVNKLENIIKSFESFAFNENDAEKRLTDFLRERFFRIYMSDAAPWINIQSPSNQLSDKIAKQLALQFYLSTPSKGKKAKEFKLYALEYFIPRYNHLGTNLKPWQWILNEDGHPSDVQTCLDHARRTGELTSITASYGDEGIKRLNTNCFNDFIRQFQDLVDWEILLQTTDFDLLKQFAFQNKKTLKEVTIQDISYGDETTYRGILLCLSEIYRRELEDRVEETQGPALFGFGLGYPKSEKLEAVKIFQTFLVSRIPLNQFQQYLFDNKLERYIPIFFDSRSVLNSTLWKSTLCTIVTFAVEWKPALTKVDSPQETHEKDIFIEATLASTPTPIPQPVFKPTKESDKPAEINVALKEEENLTKKKSYVEVANTFKKSPDKQKGIQQVISITFKRS